LAEDARNPRALSSSRLPDSAGSNLNALAAPKRPGLLISVPSDPVPAQKVGNVAFQYSPQESICASPSWSDFGGNKKKKERKRLEEERKRDEKEKKEIEKKLKKEIEKRSKEARLEKERYDKEHKLSKEKQERETKASLDKDRILQSKRDKDPKMKGARLSKKPISSRNYSTDSRRRSESQSGSDNTNVTLGTGSGSVASVALDNAYEAPICGLRPEDFVATGPISYIPERSIVEQHSSRSSDRDFFSGWEKAVDEVDRDDDEQNISTMYTAYHVSMIFVMPWRGDLRFYY
jgi:hypothetical protein